MYDSFGVSAYSYTDSWDESKTPDYFYNITASKSGGEYLFLLLIIGPALHTDEVLRLCSKKQ
ncbi:MAG: hypothetical protein ACLUUS_11830 [Bacteroides stercoris]